MLDQSFSAENFRKILEIENRKGNYYEGEFYPDLAALSANIKAINSEIRNLRTLNISSNDLFEKRKSLEQQKQDLKHSKEEKLLGYLRAVSATVTSRKFKLEIESKRLEDKTIYKTRYTLENLLVLKQLQFNFRKLYKVKQSNRYHIISHLRNIVGDGFPKFILKTDVKDFYESIPHEKLYAKLADDSLLTPLSVSFIRQILCDYDDKTGNNGIGVPRGIGISPYLVELYMRDLDFRIRNLPNVIYYSRYVDDIIVIFSPAISEIQPDYKSVIRLELQRESLVMNTEKGKTAFIDLVNVSNRTREYFEYLGYRFEIGFAGKKINPLVVTMSKRKKERYCQRIVFSLNSYKSTSKRNEKRARKLLIKRLKFITGNSRLVNNKKNIVTGVYYTNSLVNDISDFLVLDEFLKKKIETSGLSEQLQNRLRKFSFVRGFRPHSIHRFRPKDLAAVVRHI